MSAIAQVLALVCQVHANVVIATYTCSIRNASSSVKKQSTEFQLQDVNAKPHNVDTSAKGLSDGENGMYPCPAYNTLKMEQEDDYMYSVVSH